MESNFESRKVAKEFIDGQSDTTYQFAIDGYSGSVYVSEWEPVFATGDVFDAGRIDDLGTWLYKIFEIHGLDLSQDDVWELAHVIEHEILDAAHS